MCRRFSQFFSKENKEAFERNFGVPPPQTPYSRPTFNIPPGVDIHTVLRDSERNNQVREMFWASFRVLQKSSNSIQSIGLI